MKDEPLTATVESRSKPWWQSKTILGSLASMLAIVLGFYFKTEIPQEDLLEFLMGLAAVIGSGIAIYGRVTAKTEIRKATRATPVEIAEDRARRLRTGGRGGLNKGFVKPMVLAWLLIALFCLVAAFALLLHP